MRSVKFTKKIKNFAIASFLIPLIAVNSCFLIYKFVGNMNIDMYHDFNWNEVERTFAYHQYHPIHSYSEYDKIYNHFEPKTFTNCPKYSPAYSWTSVDDQIISGELDDHKNQDFYPPSPPCDQNINSVIIFKKFYPLLK